MSIATRYRPILIADGRNISRDPTLLFVTVLSFVPLVLFSFWGADFERMVRESFGLDNFIFYALPLIYCLPAFLIGWVAGFLLLEDRDDGPLIAIDVTPMGKSGFFAYRISAAMMIVSAITLLSLVVLAPQTSPLSVVSITILTVLEAAIIALALPAFARNKVEGLAISKLINIFVAVPICALIASPWRFLASPLPTFWLGEIAYRDDGLEHWPVALAALTVHGAAIFICARFAIKRVG